MRRFVLCLLLAASSCLAQNFGSSNSLSVTGDAEIKVVPDRVSIMLGVESRNKDLNAATSQTDAAVGQVIAAARNLKTEPSDIQTDFVHVDLAYNDKAPTVVDYYIVTKTMQIVLKDISHFEKLLHACLTSGANHIYGIEFSTSELRKYRDQARALAVKAALEKGRDLAAAAGLKAATKPTSVSSYSYGGGSSYAFCCRSYGAQMYQNVVQNVGSGEAAAAGSSMALGKIGVTASVTITLPIEGPF